jgi:hypothetical protein
MTDSNIETVSHCHQHVMTDSPLRVLFPSQRDALFLQSPWLEDNLHLDKTDPYTGLLSFY